MVIFLTNNPDVGASKMKTVVIIGAGPAGLSAAYELLRESSDYKVVIFEKEDSVGGLAKTLTFDGGRVDIGGHRFFSKNEEVVALWKHILPETDGGMLLRDRESHILWDSKLINYPIRLDAQTFRVIGLSKGIRVGISYLAAKIHRKTICSLEDFYIDRFGKVLYSMFFKTYTKKLWGISADALSPDWGEQRVQRISLRTLILSAFGTFQKEERSLVSQYHYPAFGSGQLWDELSRKVMALGGIIHTGCTVEYLQVEDSCVSAIEYTDGTGRHRMLCDYVISSMPLKDLLLSMNAVPIEITSIANRLSFRDMIVVALAFPKTSMGDNYQKVKKDSWVYMQDTSATFGRMQLLNNWSPYATMVDEHILLELEYFCTKGDSLWSQPNTQLVESSIRELIQCGICIKHASASYSLVRRIEKAYPVYTDGYYDLPAVESWINGIGNLQCVGRNGQHRYNNMDHAVETGLIAARNILHKDYDRERIWHVNTDREYLEKQ